MTDLVVNMISGLGMAEPVADSKTATGEEGDFPEQLTQALAGLMDTEPAGDDEAAGPEDPDASEEAGETPMMQLSEPIEAQGSEPAQGDAPAIPGEAQENAMEAVSGGAMAAIEDAAQFAVAVQRPVSSEEAQVVSRAKTPLTMTAASSGRSEAAVPLSVGATSADQAGVEKASVEQARVEQAGAGQASGERVGAVAQGEAPPSQSGLERLADGPAKGIEASVEAIHMAGSADESIRRGDAIPGRAPLGATGIEQEGVERSASDAPVRAGGAEEAISVSGREGEATGDKASGRAEPALPAAGHSAALERPAEMPLRAPAQAAVQGELDPAGGEPRVTAKSADSREQAERILMLATEELTPGRVRGDSIRLREIATGEAGKRYEASLRLHPRDLGQLRIELQLDGDEVSARIIVESEAARTQLQGDLARLRNSLSSQGFAESRIEVEIEQGRSEARDSGGEESGDKRGERNVGVASDERFVQRSLHEGIIDLRA